MVLAELGGSISRALQQMINATVVDEKVLNDCLNEISRALLQSDVQFSLVRDMQINVKKNVNLSDLAADHNKRKIIQRAVFDQLCQMLQDPSGKPDQLNKGWKPALVCADTFRAGAFDQLKQNAAKAKVPFYGSYTETDPVKIAVEGVERFKNDQSNSFDLIIVDTSGRHKQEAALSEEMRQLSEAISPDLVVFVMDASIGQSAFHQAQAFKQSVAVGAVIVTKMDGHAKGGGTLSAVAATKSPVIFIGTGEHTDQLEAFDVKPFVRRLLGMGDLPGPANKIREAVPMDQHEDILENILQGGFTLRTMQVLFQTKLKLGTPSQLASMLPAECTSRLFPVGLGDDQENQNQMKQFLVMMDSMTAQELDSPNLKVSELRRQRIARGSGHEVRQVEELIEACKAVSKNFSKGRALLRSLNSGDMRAVTRNMSGNPQLLNQVGGMGGLRSLMNLGRL
ncbi:hypothetical protein ACFX13_046429 [Malus domestica]